MCYPSDPNALYHYGVKGMRWGVRRYYNDDGTLNEKGKKRQEKGRKKQAKNRKKYDKVNAGYEAVKTMAKVSVQNRNQAKADRLNAIEEKKWLDMKIESDAFWTNWGRRKAQKKQKVLESTIAAAQRTEAFTERQISNYVVEMNGYQKRLSEIDAKYERIGRKYLLA